MPDFNSAGPQQSFDLISDGTIATVRLIIRPGQAGEGGWLRRAKDGLSEALDCELVVLDGPFAKRKFWTLLTIAGTSEGHTKAGEISRSRLRAILESARGIRADDNSEAAKQARCTTSYADFDGLSFIAQIGVEPARGGFKAKNTLDRVITPEQTAWHPVSQEPKSPTAAVAGASGTAKLALEPATKIARPTWAS